MWDWDTGSQNDAIILDMDTRRGYGAGIEE